MKTLSERFEQFEDDYPDFKKVAKPLSQRADLHAFMLLDKIQPSGGDMISSSEHDEFYLSIDCDKLAEVISDEQIQELVCCGIRFDGEYDCLCMFA